MGVTDAPSRLLTLDEVADRLRLSRRTVERMVGAELLPALRVGRRAIRVDPDELEAWLYQDAGSHSSRPQTPAVRSDSSDFERQSSSRQPAETTHRSP
jgi:excisionase family DNA binding protein